jgi:hypothetical protein
MNPKLLPDWWDPWSCQPYKIPATEKPRFGLSNLLEYSKVGATALALAPLIALNYARPKPSVSTSRSVEDFVGLSVTPAPAYLNQIEDAVSELGVNKLLLRTPCWEADDLQPYIDFMHRFDDVEFVVNVLQSRDSVRDPASFESQLKKIFNALKPRVKTFQIGNAINRSKWGCRHSGDWLALMNLAYRVAKQCGGIHLAGSSVIDFEPLVSLRTLVNLQPHKFDICASQLYVNRRGSPFGRQYGVFNLERKLRLNHAMTQLANKCPARLWISETNWPLLNTKPWTPNSGHPRSTVDEATQARYLTEYFQIAWHSQRVERVYWWQLINPGYGLVDHRNRQFRKMPSFYAFKRLLEGEINETPKPPST